MRDGLAGRVARVFLDSKLTPVLILAALALGALALLATPREEEPQIRVPMVDVTVAYPGAPPEEVERRLLDPLERAMWGLSGVEHVYGTARPGSALVTVRFRVNESNEDSLVKVYERLSSARSALPPGALPPRVTLHSIDDVPFLALTLWTDGDRADALRPLAGELAREIAELPEVQAADVIGGEPRVVRTDSQVDFGWTLSAPARGIPFDWYSVRWTGSITAPPGGVRKLGVEGNDGWRLFVDGRLLIDNWRKWLDFSLAYHRALAELEQRFADFQQLVGLPVPRNAAEAATPQEAEPDSSTVDAGGAEP